MTNVTKTTNGAKAYTSTRNSVLDLFYKGATSRTTSNSDLKHLFEKAYAEDKELTLKCIFHIRDIRGGIGERETFRRLLVLIPNKDMRNIENFGSLVFEFGRFDDLISLLDYPQHELFALEQIQEANDGLEGIDDLYAYYFFKWISSINTSSRKTVERAKKIAKYFGMSQKAYRQWLSTNRAKLNIFESKLTREGFNDIDFGKLPSRCLNKYRNAFNEHMETEYNAFLEKGLSGETTINSKDMFIYEIVKNMFEGSIQERKLGAVQWDNLPNYLEGYDEGDVIVCADISSSMNNEQCKPMYNSIGLATYFAQRNKGIFKNKYMMFSSKPMLVDLDSFGEDLATHELMRKIQGFYQGSIYNTNFEATLQELYKYVKASVKDGTYEPSIIPLAMLYVTDTQFDSIVADSDNSKTLVQTYKAKFEKLAKKHKIEGLALPNIVFWNVAQSTSNVQATEHETGITMFGGYSGSIFKSIMSTLSLTPLKAMLKILTSERYEKVKFK